MTRRRDCTCAGTAPGYPQHEYWCGLTEPRYITEPEPVEYGSTAEAARATAAELLRVETSFDALTDILVDDRDEPVELHLVPTTGGAERKPSLSACLKANGVPREQWATVSAAVAVWMRAWFSDVLDDEPDPRPPGVDSDRVRDWGLIDPDGAA